MVPFAHRSPVGSAHGGRGRQDTWKSLLSDGGLEGVMGLKVPESEGKETLLWALACVSLVRWSTGIHKASEKEARSWGVTNT